MSENTNVTNNANMTNPRRHYIDTERVAQNYERKVSERNVSKDFEYTKDYSPNYYKADNGYGKTKDLEAYEVVEAFRMNHNFGAVFTYMVRAYKKHEHPVSDIKKAIKHLELQLKIEEERLLEKEREEQERIEAIKMYRGMEIMGSEDVEFYEDCMPEEDDE